MVFCDLETMVSRLRSDDVEQYVGFYRHLAMTLPSQSQCRLDPDQNRPCGDLQVSQDPLRRGFVAYQIVPRGRCARPREWDNVILYVLDRARVR